MDFLMMQVASGAPQALLGAAAVSTVLGLEVPRRVAGIRVETLGIRKCARSVATVVCACAPEVMGLFVVLVLAVILRLRGDTEVMFDPVSQKVWEQIKVEWPILMGADTLLNLQAMLRLLVLCFMGMRAHASGLSPLTGIPALLFLAAALSRGMLSARTEVYRLEGPLSLGGDLPVACEVAGVAFWAAMGRSGLTKSPVAATAMVSFGIWFASHHYLNLAKDPSTDQLFIQAHILELLASFAYVARSFSLMVGGEDEEGKPEGAGSQPPQKPGWRSNAFVGFMHMVLTMQQAFSAYYFLTAFEPHSSLVGAGRPFCVLCIGNLLSLGAFLLATVFWAGGCVDATSTPAEEDVQSPTVTEVIQDEDEPESPTTTELEALAAEEEEEEVQSECQDEVLEDTS